MLFAIILNRLVTCRTTFYIVNYKWAKTHPLKQIAHPLQAFRPQKIIFNIFYDETVDKNLFFTFPKMGYKSPTAM